jgi:hypothetical protein
MIALRPRLAAGVAELVEICEHRGVEITLLDGGSAAARSVARRAGVTFQPSDAAAEAVRARQADGKMVALVSDSAHAAEGFGACDLAIGLVSGWSSHFPARADLLASDLGAVAAIVEAGARREAAVRDSILLYMVANILGAVWGFRGAPRVERASHARSMSHPLPLCEVRGLSREGRPTLGRRHGPGIYRNLRKKWRMSPMRRSGASWAAQWLPRSYSLQETMLVWSRSANLRIGLKS